MKRWITGIAAAVWFASSEPRGIGPHFKNRYNPINNWRSQPTSAWAKRFGLSPTWTAHHWAEAQRRSRPLRSPARSPPASFSRAWHRGVSLLAANDLGCQYDAQTYPDALSSGGLQPTDPVPDCSVSSEPGLLQRKHVVDRLFCLQSSRWSRRSRMVA